MRVSQIMGEIGIQAVLNSLSPDALRLLPEGSRRIPPQDLDIPIIAVQHEEPFWHIYCNFRDQAREWQALASLAIEKAVDDGLFGIDGQGKVFDHRGAG